MNYLTKFFTQAVDEDGNLIVSRDVTDGFAGIIYFSEDHWIDCQISIDESIIYENYLDSKQEYMYDAFVEYVQQEMKESILEDRDREATQYYLNKTAHW